MTEKALLKEKGSSKRKAILMLSKIEKIIRLIKAQINPTKKPMLMPVYFEMVFMLIRVYEFRF